MSARNHWLCGLALYLLALSPVTASEWVSGKVEADSAQAKSVSAVYSHRVGKIHVIELAGALSATDLQARQEITRAFYEEVADQFDFLILVSDFEQDLGELAGRYIAVFNDTSGIGKATFDWRAEYGAGEQLQGLIELGSVRSLALSRFSAEFDDTLDTVMHEMMHRWGTSVRFIDDSGMVSESLLGFEASHYPPTASTQGSVMGGARWLADESDFVAQQTHYGYSDLDLYLAGFLPAAEVRPISILEGALLEADSSLYGRYFPAIGQRVVASEVAVSIDQITAAMGSRNPTYLASQRAFRAGLVYLVRPGETMPPSASAGLHDLLTEAEVRFSTLTRGAATLSTRFDDDLPLPLGAPIVIEADGVSQPVFNREAAEQWLAAQLDPVSSLWGDKTATVFRDTASVLRVSAITEGLRDQQALARVALAALEAPDLDALSRQLPSFETATQGALDTLMAAQRPDGGWGLAVGAASATQDTAVIARALLGIVDPSHPALRRAADWLDSAKLANGMWPVNGSGRADVATTLTVLDAQRAGLTLVSDGSTTRDSLTQYLSSSHLLVGDMGLTALAIQLWPDGPRRDQMMAALASSQLANGSVANGVYATAMAVLALDGDQAGNLELQLGTVLPSAPRLGEVVSFAAQVRNSGSVNSSTVALELIDVADGSVIDQRSVAPLPVGAARATMLYWDSLGSDLDRSFQLHLNRDNRFVETQLADNVVDIDVALDGVAAATNLLLLDNSATVNPATIDRLPTVVAFNAQLRNLGSTSVVTHVDLQRQTPTGWSFVSREAVEIAAMQTVDLTRSKTINHLDEIATYRLTVDDENEIFEEREDDNWVEFTLASEPTRNLEIVLFESAVGSDVVVGGPVELQLHARNTGTQFVSEASLVVDAGGTEVYRAGFSWAPGESRELMLDFVPNTPGEVLLTAQLDPDNLVIERDENDNSAALVLNAAISQQPNLFIAPNSLTVSPNPVFEGQQADVTGLIENRSAVSAPTSTLSLRTSQAEAAFAELVVPQLPASGSFAFSAELPTNHLPDSPMVVTAVLDATDAIAESNETDNVAIAQVNVRRLPDLAIGDGSVSLDPADAPIGAVMTLEVLVVNRGEQTSLPVELAVIEITNGLVGEPPAQMVAVPPIEAGQSTLLQAMWTRRPEVSALQVSVDYGHVQAETDEQNNTVVVPLELAASGRLSVSPRWISPDGDGVQDIATVRFRLAPEDQVAQIAVIDWMGQNIRVDQIGGLSDGEYVWDGRDWANRLVADGQYQIQLIGIDGVSLGSVFVALDLNRSSVLDGLVSGRAITDQFVCDRGFNAKLVTFDGDWLYTDQIEIAGVTQTGLFRVHARNGSTQTLLSEQELAALGGQITRLRITDSGVVVFELGNRWWRYRHGSPPIDLGWQGRPVLRSSGRFHHPEQEVVATVNGSMIGEDYRDELSIIPLATAAATQIGTMNGEYVDAVLRHGVILRHNYERRLRYLAFDGTDQLLWQGSASAIEDAFLSVAHDGSSFAIVKGFERTRVLGNYDSEQFDREVDIGYEVWRSNPAGLVEVTGGVVQQTALWDLSLDFTGDREFVITDGKRGALTFFNDAGLMQGEIVLPLTPLPQFSAEEGEFGEVFSREFTVAHRRPNRSTFQGPRLALPGDRPRFAVTVATYLTSASDATRKSSFPLELRKQFIDSQTFVIDADRRQLTRSLGASSEVEQWAWYAGGDTLVGRTTSDADVAWDLVGNGIMTFESELDGLRLPANGLTRQPFIQFIQQPRRANCTNPPDDLVLTTWTRENLTSLLRLEVGTTAIGFTATVDDQAIRSSWIEWRLAESDDWNVLTAPRSGALDAEFLGSWQPPEPGDYDVRLVAVDRAGNRSFDQHPLVWYSPATLTDVLLSEAFVSPNGDGIQDETEVGFLVRQPATILATVTDDQGRVVRRFDLRYPTVPTMRQTIIWDARDDAGALVDDGTYRLTLAGHSRVVVVDTRAPQVALRLPSIYRQADAGDWVRPSYMAELDVEDANEVISTLSVDRGFGFEFLLETGNLDAALNVDGEDYRVGAFQIAAVDAAGNQSVRLASAMPQALIHTVAQSNVERVRFVADEQQADTVIVQFDRAVRLGIETVGDPAQLILEASPDILPRQWSPISVRELSGNDLPTGYANTVWLEIPSNTLQQAVAIRPTIVGDGATSLNEIVLRDLSAAGLELVQALDADEEIEAWAATEVGAILVGERKPGLVVRPGSPYIATDGLPFVASVDQSVIVAFQRRGTVDNAAAELRVESLDDLRYLVPQTVVPDAAYSDPRGLFELQVYVLPTSACSQYQLEWVATDRSTSVRRPLTRSCLRLTAAPQSSLGEFCDATNDAGRGIGIKLQTDDPSLQLSRLEVFALQGEAPLRIFNDNAACNNLAVEPCTVFVPLSLAADRFSVRAVDNQGLVTATDLTVPVDRSSPSVEIIAPQAGERVCASATVPVRVSLQALVSDDAMCAATLQASSGWSSVQFDGDAKLAELMRLGLCNQRLFDLTTAVEPTPASGEREVTLLLEVADLSGARTCEFIEVELDSEVEAELSADTALIGINASNGPAQASITLDVGEPLTVDVHVYAAEPGLPAAQVDRTVVLDELAANQGVVDSLDVTWPATGSHWDDGWYLIEFTATDSCGLQVVKNHLVEIDSTPPSIALVSPLASEDLQAVTPIIADIDDANFLSADIALHRAGERFDLVRIDAPTQGPEAVAQWSLAGYPTGSYQLRITAIDRLGWQTQIEQTLVLLEPDGAKLYTLSLAPSVISPNGDGTLDVALLDVGLRQDAIIALDAVDQGGETTRIINDLSLSSGLNTVPLDAVALPDGPYELVLTVDENDSPEHGYLSLIIDTQPPDISFNRPANAIMFGEQPLVFAIGDLTTVQFAGELLGEDGQRIQIGPSTESLVSIALDGLSEQAWVLSLLAQDAAGNTSTAAHRLVLDQSVPIVEFTFPAPGAIVPGRDRPTVIAVAGEDAHLVAMSLDVMGDRQLAVTSTGSTLEFSDVLLLDDGQYSLLASARDAAGLESIAQLDVTVDNQPPVVAILAPADQAWTRPTAPIAIDVDDLHLRDYRLEVGPTNAGPWRLLATGSDAISGTVADWPAELGMGQFFVRLTATDAAGWTSVSMASIQIDSQPPSPPTLEMPSISGRDVQLAWAWPAESDVIRVDLRRDGVVIFSANSESAFTDTKLAEGRYTYDAIAVDRAGNQSQPSNTRVVDIDTTPPTVELLAPFDGALVSKEIEVIGSVAADDDLAGFTLALSRSGELITLRSGTTPQLLTTLLEWNTRTVADGVGDLVLSAVDRAGNSATASIALQVDNTAPASPDGLVAQLEPPRDVVLTWQAGVEPDLAGYRIRRDQTWLNVEPLTTPSFRDQHVGDGQYSYAVYAVDQAGNLSQPSAVASISIDTRPPELAFIEPAPGHRFDSLLTVRVGSANSDTDLDVVELYWSSDGAMWTSIGSDTQAPFDWQLDPAAFGWTYGTIHLQANGVDTAGNPSVTPITLNVEYADLTAPARVADVSVTAVSGGDVTVSWQASADTDLNEYLVYLGGENASELAEVGRTSATNYRVQGLDDGRFAIAIAAADQSGNVSPLSDLVFAEVFSIAIDTPYSPTGEPTATLTGRSPQAGDLMVDGQFNQGVTASAAFTADVALALGSNALALQVEIAPQFTSRTAQTRIERGERLPAPTDLAAQSSAAGAAISWQSVPGAASYAVLRDGEWFPAAQVVVPDVAGQAASSRAHALPNVFDAESDDNWSASSSDWGDGEAWVELTLNASYLIDSIVVKGAVTEVVTPVTARVFGFDGVVWRPLAAQSTVNAFGAFTLREPYQTDRLRLVFSTPEPNRYESPQIRALTIGALQLLAQPELVDDSGGYHDYEVAAVSPLGLLGHFAALSDVAAGDVVPPAAPNLTAIAQGVAVALTWSASTASDIASYRVFRDGVLVAVIALSDLTDPSQPSWLDGPVADGQYRFWVQAVDAVGNVSERSNEVSVLVADEPAGAQDLIATVTSGRTVELGWGVTSGSIPHCFDIQREVSGSDWQLIVGCELWPGGTPSYIDIAPSVGELNRYRVRHQSPNGAATAWSNTAQVYVPMPVQAPSILYPLDGTTAASAVVDVIGDATPGQALTVLRDGQQIAYAIANTQARLDPELLVIPASAHPVSLSADGQWLALGDQSNRLLGLGSGLDLVLPGDDVAEAFGWGQNVLYTVSDDVLYQTELPSGASSELLRWSRIDAVSAADDGSALVVVGEPVRFEDTMAAWVNPSDGSWTQIDGIAPGRGTSAADMAWSDDGQLMLYERSADRIHLIRDGLRVPQDVASDLQDFRYFGVGQWAPDGNRFATIGYTNNYELMLAVVDLNTGQEQRLPLDREPSATIWTQGDDLLLLFSDEIAVVDLDLASVVPIAAIERTNFDQLRELGGGLLRAVTISGDFPETYSLALIGMPGVFRFVGVPLLAGANTLQVTSRDGVLASDPIVVFGPEVQAPDVGIVASSLSVSPANSVLGSPLQASVAVKNYGETDSGALELKAQVIAPDGQRWVGHREALSLAVGEQQQRSWPLVDANMAGDYLLIVSIAQTAVSTDRNLDNNLAHRRFTRTLDAQPSLSIVPDASAFAADVAITGKVYIDNPGARIDGEVEISLADLTGEQSIAHSTHAVAVPSGGSTQLDFRWPTADLLAGSYRLEAVLRTVTAELSRVVTNIELKPRYLLSIDLPVIAETQAGDELQAAPRVTYDEGNALIDGAIVRVFAEDSSGVTIWTQDVVLPTLVPGND